MGDLLNRARPLLIRPASHGRAADSDNLDVHVSSARAGLA